ncbi:hypothetical protein [Neobacillus niacini]|uniref:hypothetical protein n=1 Tax=Neobacillus niacini TaxID=86668 RepID=UPI0039831833
MFWNRNSKDRLLPVITRVRNTRSLSFKLVVSALMGLIAAILQSAGGIIPGIGMLISPLATAPIIISMLIYPAYGLLSYFLTIFLLLLIQPSELIVFPFTTGAMGIGIGLGLLLFNKVWKVVSLSSLFLTTGICLLLYIIQFPILGPLFMEISIINILMIYLFSLLYCWMWTGTVGTVLAVFFPRDHR